MPTKTSSSKQKETRALLRGLAFLSPNILGFLAFTLIPIVFSFAMAFSNWDLTLHNPNTDVPLRFVGLGNFIRLFAEPLFWQYLGNTFFLMLGIPFGIAGSLGLAVLLSSKLNGPRGEYLRPLVILAVSLSSALLFLTLGLTGSAFAAMFIGLAGLMFTGGALGGSTVYRTFFYLPHFTQGVAIFILWKKMYNPQSGPINQGLAPLLEGFASLILLIPPGIAAQLVLLPLLLVGLGFFLWLKGTAKKWAEGELGRAALFLSTLFLIGVPALLEQNLPVAPLARGFFFAFLLMVVALSAALQTRKRFETAPAFEGTGGHLLFSGFMLTLICFGVILTSAFSDLPVKAAAGIEPPNWLTDFHWAKPSLIFMGLWASIGGNNMILFLAGISNISPDYYEAADIDGADGWQKFKFITWPQLAPVTFFIVVMSFISGLQGGFEMARTMTGGGPAGATTTLSYFIYSEGFETGRLGYASAIAWVLFLLVFVMSMFNWKFGNRYVSE